MEPELFWSKVDVKGPDDCWEWTACRHTSGYGVVFLKESGRYRQRRAHRYAYELAKGPIPDGFVVMHHCDNPACCNPLHLSACTQADNMQDMWSKGRGVRNLQNLGDQAGERNNNAKLTRQKALEIRELARRPGAKQGEIARQYGVSRPLVSLIKNNYIWR